ncbi:hypothetical protein [Enterovirga aerilata]|uniref:BA14K family protein n=1 Tax=Enterovirga aerilata TaxID=2730920 RepID=A0A849I341_9HYPH|nr:hypothetical protein [Enterovirga sp. DB1703]NNM70805.1 hypothetical protein [Enterovirga sp. DB1703]
MPNHLRQGRLAAGLGLVLAASAPAGAADYGSRSGPGGPPVLEDGAAARSHGYEAWGAPPRPHRRPVNGGPGYVGSDYGLGKPAFTGLGSRPDWGYSE